MRRLPVRSLVCSDVTGPGFDSEHFILPHRAANAVAVLRAGDDCKANLYAGRGGPACERDGCCN